ncbi:calcineurin-like phosphoesterase [Xylariales sp. PMI_506]|nr:calcineurin-like phosphoesterase [Xylariales sp. PMI_506]
MGILQALGLRRRVKWDNTTILDKFLDSPLQEIVLRLYLIVLWLRGTPVRPPPGRAAIKVVCLSDTHDKVVENVPDGDLLIHAGDMTNSGTVRDIQKQIDWLASLPHKHKVVVCGNHDSWFDIRSRKEEDQLSGRALDLKGIHYLYNKSITLDFKDGRKLNVYGSGDIPYCGGLDYAYQYLHQEQPWAGRIPIDTDILITHTPPKYHLDLDLGCPGLLEETWRVRPKLHIFGHLHCARGIQAAFWDDCQRTYESFARRGKHGPIIDALPSGRWLDVLCLLLYGIQSVVWQWLMLGGSSNGSLMVNAGCQDGNTGRLTRKRPFVVSI